MRHHFRFGSGWSVALYNDAKNSLAMAFLKNLKWLIAVVDEKKKTNCVSYEYCTKYVRFYGIRGHSGVGPD